jgi:integrase
MIDPTTFPKLPTKRTRQRGRRGDGSIEKLPNGRFRAVFSLGIDPATGKRRKVTANFATLKEAKDWRAAKRTELATTGRVIASGRMTVGEWLDKWLKLQKPKVAPKTYAHDETRVRLHLKPRLGSVPLGKLDSLQVQQLYADMANDGKSASEQNKAGGVLRRALANAVRAKLVPYNVAKEERLPKVRRKEITPLTLPQAAALLAAADGHRLATLFDFALDVGPRMGELFGLHWSDVNLDAGTVTIRHSLEELSGNLRLKDTKTENSRRTIILAKRTVAALRQHLDRMQGEGHDVTDGILFPAAEGGYLRQSNFLRRVLRPILAAAGLPTIRPYDLRHTSATLLLASGQSVKAVSRRLGHDDIETTLRHYAHVLPNDYERVAAAVDDLFATVSPKIVPKLGHVGQLDSTEVVIK